MNKLRTVCSHLTVILALMFLVFLGLDQFTPMMYCVDINISRWLLSGLCLSSAAQSLLYWKADSRPEDR